MTPDKASLQTIQDIKKMLIKDIERQLHSQEEMRVMLTKLNQNVDEYIVALKHPKNPLQLSPQQKEAAISTLTDAKKEEYASYFTQVGDIT